MESRMDSDGVRWISCDVLCVGDYGGAGSVGEANIRCLKDREDCVVLHGAYYSKQAWLIDNFANGDLIRKLEKDYPCIDDEQVSRVEMEWEQEAWESWLRSDLLQGLPDELGEVVEDDLDNAALWDCYRAAMEEENEYPIPEHSGVCVRVKEIQETFNWLVIEKLMQIG